jgi:hypothetical protein
MQATDWYYVENLRARLQYNQTNVWQVDHPIRVDSHASREVVHAQVC